MHHKTRRKRHEVLRSSPCASPDFKGKLYHPTDPSFPVKQHIVEKIAGTRLSYQHLEDIFQKFGEKALIGVLSLPPASNATGNKSQYRSTLSKEESQNSADRKSIKLTFLR